MKTAMLVLALTAAALVTMKSLEAASPDSYRMLVNHGAGWSEAGDFRTLEECKREAALYAAKHSAQAGCAEVSTLAETRFHQTAAWCAQRASVKIIHKPGAKLTILGTTEERFAFDECMAQSGQPTEGAR